MYFDKCETFVHHSLIDSIRSTFKSADWCWNLVKMRRHVVLHPRLDQIMLHESKNARGADGEDYYRIKYEIHARYYSAHCDYSLWVGGRNQGTVEVQYSWILRSLLLICIYLHLFACWLELRRKGWGGETKMQFAKFFALFIMTLITSKNFSF